VTKRFTKPVVAIWQELNGTPVLAIETQPKETYASIQKVKTFTPASAEREMVYAQLVKNRVLRAFGELFSRDPRQLHGSLDDAITCSSSQLSWVAQ
jgi:hypothetical protein